MVTDHNSEEWIDGFRAALNQLKQDAENKWAGFEVFPGVEISCNSSIHLIAIFDSSKQGADIDGLIGSVGYQGGRGNSDGVTNSSVEDVIAKVHQEDGIACATHIDMPKGLLSFITDHNTLLPIFDKLNAVEIINPASEVIEKNKSKLDEFAVALG